MSLRIPLAKPEVTDADREAVLQVLRSSFLSMGPKLDEFEKAISTYVGSRFAVAVNSGTSALHLALKTLALSPGAEVILPSFTFVAPLNVLLQERLQPVFVDIDSKTLNVTAVAVEAAITSKTKAIIAIHTFGRPVAIDQLRSIADRHKIYLIEDACEALGAEITDKKQVRLGISESWHSIPINKSPLVKAECFSPPTKSLPLTPIVSATRGAIPLWIGINKPKTATAIVFQTSIVHWDYSSFAALKALWPAGRLSQSYMKISSQPARTF